MLVYIYVNCFTYVSVCQYTRYPKITKYHNMPRLSKTKLHNTKYLIKYFMTSKDLFLLIITRIQITVTYWIVIYMKMLLCILATLVLIKMIIHCACNLILGIISMNFRQCCQCGMIMKMMIGMDTFKVKMSETHLRVSGGFNSEEVIFYFGHSPP